MKPATWRTYYGYRRPTLYRPPMTAAEHTLSTAAVESRIAAMGVRPAFVEPVDVPIFPECVA